MLNNYLWILILLMIYVFVVITNYILLSIRSKRINLMTPLYLIPVINLLFLVSHMYYLCIGRFFLEDNLRKDLEAYIRNIS